MEGSSQTGGRSSILKTVTSSKQCACPGCENPVKKLTALFEPMMIIGMGLIVGFVAIALVSAMYGIFNQVKVQ